MNRLVLRSILLVAILVGLFSGTQGPAAQVSTPDAASDQPFASLRLPAIAVTITADAFEGMPSELTAGRYVLSVTNTLPPRDPSAGPPSTGVVFLQVPPELTAEDFIAMMGSDQAPPDGGSPAAGAGPMGPPPWYYETVVTGGPYALPGETTYAVIDLPAGEWMLWSTTPGVAQAPVPVTVSGEPPADQPSPAADVTVTMNEYSFSFSPELSAGSLILEVVNAGRQPHFLAVFGVPAETTVDDALAFFDSLGAPMATPAGGLGFADLRPVLDTADQSTGITAWYAADLEPGTYLLACFVPDAETGAPHAMMGMIQVVEVE